MEAMEFFSSNVGFESTEFSQPLDLMTRVFSHVFVLGSFSLGVQFDCCLNDLCKKKAFFFFYQGLIVKQIQMSILSKAI